MSINKRPPSFVLVLGVVLGLMRASERPAIASPLDFEGLDAACDASTTNTGIVFDGYGGLNWMAYSPTDSANVQVECDANYMGPDWLNNYGAPSSSYAAYNPWGFGEVDASVESGTFTFSGASFSSFAYDDDYYGGASYNLSAISLAILGYRPEDGVNPFYSTGFDLATDQYRALGVAQHYELGVEWTGLNRLVFLAGDGLYGEETTIFGGDRMFLMDDVDVSVQTPEPGSVLLLGTGLLAVARSLKRRRRGVETTK